MAVITTFRKAPHTTGAAQPTRVECVWKAFDVAGSRILQLDTFGSAERKNPGKQSQTLQLNRRAAQTLMDILRQAFPDLR
jgi:hypothetical protein